MSAYNGNDAYLTIDGIDVSPYWGGTLNLGGYSAAVEDITSGSNKEWMEYAVGMKGGDSYEISLRYFPDDWATYRGIFATSEQVAMVYGWHGNDAGRPVFDADVIIVGFTPVLSHSRAVMEITLTMQLTGTPRRVPYEDSFT